VQPSTSHVRGSSLFLTACISGFPAFAGMTGRSSALSSPSRMRGSILVLLCILPSVRFRVIPWQMLTLGFFLGLRLGLWAAHQTT